MTSNSWPFKLFQILYHFITARAAGPSQIRISAVLFPLISLVFLNCSFISPSRKANTADKSFLARYQGVSATTESAPAPEFLRLPRCSTPPRCLEEQDRSSTIPLSDRNGRFEMLDDVTSRKATPHCSEGQGRAGSHPPIDRVGRRELLNDVTGRELRVYRKSPCPLHRRTYSINAQLHTPRLNYADFIEERKLRPGAHHPPASHDEFLARRHFERPPRVISLETKLTSSFEVCESVVHTPIDDPGPTEEERSPRCSEGQGRRAS